MTLKNGYSKKLFKVPKMIIVKYQALLQIYLIISCSENEKLNCKNFRE